MNEKVHSGQVGRKVWYLGFCFFKNKTQSNSKHANYTKIKDQPDNNYELEKGTLKVKDSISNLLKDSFRIGSYSWSIMSKSPRMPGLLKASLEAVNASCPFGGKSTT